MEVENTDRIYDVFVLGDSEYLLGAYYEDEQLKVKIYDESIHATTIYEPDMSERPEALAYILGERDDFKD